jgi:hypothetical protein
MVTACAAWAADEKPAAEKKPAAKLSPEDEKKRDDANRTKEEAIRKQKEAAQAKAGAVGDKGGAFKMMELPKTVQEALTEEQKTKLATLKSEYGPRLETATAAVRKILTPELSKGQAEAASAAAKKYLDDNLSDAQKADLKSAQESLESLHRELREKMVEFLPEDQRAKFKQAANPQEKKPGAESPKKPGADAPKKPSAEATKKPAPAGEKGASEKQLKKTDDAKKPAAAEPKKS